MRKVKTKRITTAALGLGLIAMIWLGATITRAEEPAEPPRGIVVTPQEGSVYKTDKVESIPEATVPQYINIADGTVTIVSVAIIPPTGWQFIPFPNYPDIYADVEIPVFEGGTPMLTGFHGDDTYHDGGTRLNPHLNKDQQEALSDGSFHVFAFFDESSLPNAGRFPLRAEGNMVPPPGGSGPSEWHWSIKTGMVVDLDVDSTNHWGADYFTANFQSDATEKIEDDTGQDKPGKIVFVNDIDKDGDNIPDYMDGWDCRTIQIPTLKWEKPDSRQVNSEECFVPIIFQINVPSSLSNHILVRFDYDWSPPTTMTHITHQVNIGPNGQEDVQLIKSASGKIRLWRKAGNQPRDKIYDFIFACGREYSLAELEMQTSVPKTFYVEGINASSNWSDVRIVAEVSIDDGAHWQLSDAVRLTCVRSNFTVGVVRQFVKISEDTREFFSPSYSNPKAMFEGAYNAYYETEKVGYGSPGSVNRWWHDPDATLGHGFAYFQYEGPAMGGGADLMRNQCIARSDYDNAYHFGKTGSSGVNPWNEDSDCSRNTQEELAWWHYCPYEIGSKPLVLQKSWTMNPWAMSAMFNSFNLDNRYMLFGLNINRSTGSWGCLSNVGLILHDFSFSGFTGASPDWKWHFEHLMPSSLNRSVWNAINLSCKPRNSKGFS